MIACGLGFSTLLVHRLNLVLHTTASSSTPKLVGCATCRIRRKVRVTGQDSLPKALTHSMTLFHRNALSIWMPKVLAVYVRDSAWSVGALDSRSPRGRR